MTPTHVTLHHSLTKDSGTASWQAIRRFHTSHKCGGDIVPFKDVATLRDQGRHVSNPWRDIGYHYGIEAVNDHQEILVGRMMNETGAHCPQENMNRVSLGICFVGNFDIVMPPVDQWTLGVRLVRSIVDLFDIPFDNIRGHRDYNSHKSCPGKLFNVDMFRAAVKGSA
jgi:N-acetylmuramoyl-L-alanine amidase